MRSGRDDAKMPFEIPRSGRQGRKSWRVQVPLPSIARFGRLAYPLLGEVTNRDMRGRKSHSGPGEKNAPTVGTTRVASTLGGLNITKLPAAPRTKARVKSFCGSVCQVPTCLGNGEGRCRVGRNEYMHHLDSRGKGPSIRGKMCGDNAGKDHFPAGTCHNLQRPTDGGRPREVGGTWFGA